jgi:formylglycine-generating enzyme required for sulfatase activity
MRASDLKKGVRMKIKPRWVCIAAAIALFCLCGTSYPTYSSPPRTLPLLRHIAGGTFQMGSTNGLTDEQPVHGATVSSFFMDTTEVTQADYTSIMNINPSYFKGDSLRPIETVTWFDALLYCNERSKRDGLDTIYSYASVSGTPGDGCSNLGNLTNDMSKSGYRLPTEAEWEYACRAGSTTDYSWGRNFPPITHEDSLAMDSNAVWWRWPYSDFSSRVATKLPNALGLYDMSGNVSEWCNDWYGSYLSGSAIDPTGPATGTYRILRGGAYVNSAISQLSSFRGYVPPDKRASNFGFRCVRR